MKVAILALALSHAVTGTVAIAAPKISSAVRATIPRAFNIDSPELAEARKELAALVRDCGEGVVEGVRAENRCQFNVRLDELFFEPMKNRTGLLHDTEWAAQDGVTWLEPTATRDELPEKFDLRDHMPNGQPAIKRQNCGDCWAWATHHGLEIARAVHDGEVLDLSVQTVLSCSKSGSCSGGYMSAVDFLKYGLPDESDFPYAGSNKSCKYSTGTISSGWDPKVPGTPYIGNSRDYSLARRGRNGRFEMRDGNKVQQMMQAMYEWQSPLVVTVSAFDISGPGIYDRCGAINSGGNHMVAISGWETVNGKRIANVWNSWGHSHGDKGVSRIQWECGDGKLNRGLGYSAKIVQYKSPCSPPNAQQVYLHQITPGQSVSVGKEQEGNTTCRWTPTTGLTNPNACVTTARPSVTTEYHLTAQNACGSSSSITLVQVWDLARKVSAFERVLTPDGMIRVRR